MAQAYGPTSASTRPIGTVEPDHPASCGPAAASLTAGWAGSGRTVDRAAGHDRPAGVTVTASIIAGPYARTVSIDADPTDPGPELLAFLTERHLATLTTLRPDGRLHVVPVGFTYEPVRRLARVITFAPSRKARNVAAAPGGPAVLCQVDGGRWVTLEGTAVLRDDATANLEATTRYAARYRPPKQQVDRVTIEIEVRRIVGTWRSRV